MLEPHEVDDLVFGESNAGDWLLIECKQTINGVTGMIQAAFIPRERVEELRDWINNWLNLPLKES
jgi:hypothetical protein